MNSMKPFDLPGLGKGKISDNSLTLPSIEKSSKSGRFARTIVLAAAALLGAAAVVPAQSYSGQAAAARLTVRAVGQPVATTAVADTGELPSTGGNVTLASVGVNLSPVANLGSSSSAAQGSGSGSTATGSINNVSVGVLSNTIAADAISATANATCPGQTVSGGSTITNLRINGSTVSVTGAPNQTVQILLAGTPVGTLVINEQIVTPRSVTVNALHLTVTDPVSLTVTDLVVASARAGINCGLTPISTLYSGRGTGVNLRQADVLFGDVRTLLGDTGPLPTSGGSLGATTAGASLLGGLIGTGAVTSSTSGGVPSANESRSASSVDNLGVNLLAGTVTIGATVLSSNTQCTCSLAVPTCTGASTLTGLAVRVLGLPVSVTVTGAPNQVVNIPVPLVGSIKLTLNGRESGGPADITAYPLRVETNLAGLVATDLIVASSHSDIVCALPPSAGTVTVAGRATDPNGRSLPRVLVTVAGASGVTKTAHTNSFGYYRIEGVPSGEDYVVTAEDRRYEFAPRVISAQSDLTDVDFSPAAAGATPPSKGTIAPPAAEREPGAGKAVL